MKAVTLTGKIALRHRERQRGLMNRSMLKVRYIFGLSTKERQFRHYRQAKGRSRSVTWDDLRKVKMHCQMSDVVIFLPKSRHNVAIPVNDNYMTETTTSVKKSVRVHFTYDVVAPCPDLAIFCQVLRHKGCPLGSAKFQRDPLSASVAIAEKLIGVHHPCPCAGEG